MTMVPELLKLAVDLLPGGASLAVFLSPVRLVILGALIIGFLVFRAAGPGRDVAAHAPVLHLWPFKFLSNWSYTFVSQLQKQPHLSRQHPRRQT